MAAADVDYDMIPTAATTFTVTITKNGTTITEGTNPPAGWVNALKEYTGYTFESGKPNTNLKVKSSKWGENGVKAEIKIDKDGSVTVTYIPETIKDIANKKSAS